MCCCVDSLTVAPALRQLPQPLRRWPSASIRRCMVRKFIPLAAAALALTACAVGPDYHKPTVQTAPTFVEAEPGVYSTGDSIGPFWGQFGDDLLNALMIQSLAANHDLRIAVAHLQQA